MSFEFPTTAPPGSMHHVTQVKRAFLEKLLAELPIQLQAADLLAGDGITTPVPTSSRSGFRTRTR